MRVGARLVTTALVASVAVLPLAAPAHHAAAAPPAALLVGDSVMHGLAQGYAAPARAALAARHSYILDSAGCRRLITTSCSIGGGPRPSNALSVVRERAGQYHGTLVVAVGYNDPPSGDAGLATAVDVLVQAARESSIHDVVWLTYREAGPAGNVARFRANNDVLRAKLGEHPELRLADWNAASSGLPSGWFSADGIHLGADAARAMADLIGDALDEAPPARCRSDLVLGDAPPPIGPAGYTSAPGGLHLLDAPSRLLDTRQWTGKLGAGRVVAVPVAGQSGVPDELSAAVVSVVAVDPCDDGYLTAYPCGATMPVASVVNARRATTVANTALVATGGSGAVCVYASASTDVIVDLTAIVTNGATGVQPVAPQRIVDTRSGVGPLLAVPQQRIGPAGLTVDLTSVLAGPPADAVTVNLTAVGPAAAGFLSLVPGGCAVTVPGTSSLNVRAGRDAAVASTVRLADGRFCVFSDVATDVVLDLQAVHSGAGGAITPIAPTRLLDSRDGRQPITAGTELRIPAAVPAGASALIVNVTAVDAGSAGYLSLYPCGQVPAISNVNFGAGQATANFAVVAAGPGGDVCAVASSDTHVVIDVAGWIA